MIEYVNKSVLCDRFLEMRVIKFIAIFTIYFTVASTTCAQVSKDFGSTGMTSHSPKNKHNEKDHRKKRLVHLIKNDGKGLLIGNACMNEVTHSMGFEYVVQSKGQAGNPHELGRFFINLGAKTIILFRNGPFWKIKLNRKRKECRELTGDHLG